MPDRRIFLVGATLSLIAAAVFAYAHQVNRATAQYGGQVTDSGAYHVELVVDSKQFLRVYVRQKSGMIVAPEDVTARALIRYDRGTAPIAVTPSRDMYLVSTEPIRIPDYRLIEVDLEVAYGGRAAARLQPR